MFTAEISPSLSSCDGHLRSDRLLTQVLKDPSFFQVSYSWVTGVCSRQKTARTWLWGLVITHEQSIYLLLSPKSQEYEDKASLRTEWVSHIHMCTCTYTPTHTGTIAYCFEVEHLKALFPIFMSHHFSSMHITVTLFKRFTWDPLGLQETRTYRGGWDKVPLKTGILPFYFRPQRPGL